jgi:peptide deformylase
MNSKFLSEKAPMRVITVKDDGDEILRKRAMPITKFGGWLKNFVARMAKTMYANRGIGIAAPQVGESLAVFVVDVSGCIGKSTISPGKASPTCIFDGKEVCISDISPIAMVNPNITDFSEETSELEEGCLSMPNVKSKVRRPNSIAVEFFDTCGKMHVLKCDRIFSRCIQHENDHLWGILFPDKVHKIEIANS